MTLRRVCATAIGLLAVACSAPPANVPTPKAPKPVQSLVGKIRPESTRMAVGQDLIVDYLLVSTDAKPRRLVLTENSKDPDAAWHNYSFNAVLLKDNKVPLQLIFMGRPLLGPQTLDPNRPVLFQRIRWRASRPGSYRLTFSLVWKAGEVIRFPPTMVEVTGTGGATESAPVTTRPEVAAKVATLVGELEALRTAGKWSERDPLKRKLVALGAEAARPLCGQLGHAAEEVQAEVMSVLIQLGRPAIVPLLEATRDTRSTVRYRAAFALGQIRTRVTAGPGKGEVDKALLPRLLELARTDDDLQVRIVGLTLVRQIAAPEAAGPVLLEGLSSKELELRRTCHQLLSSLTSRTVEFDAAGDEAARAAGIERWKAALAGK